MCLHLKLLEIRVYRISAFFALYFWNYVHIRKLRLLSGSAYFRDTCTFNLIFTFRIYHFPSLDFNISILFQQSFFFFCYLFLFNFFNFAFLLFRLIFNSFFVCFPFYSYRLRIDFTWHFYMSFFASLIIRVSFRPLFIRFLFQIITSLNLILFRFKFISPFFTSLIFNILFNFFRGLFFLLHSHFRFVFALFIIISSTFNFFL